MDCITDATGRAILTQHYGFIKGFATTDQNSCIHILVTLCRRHMLFHDVEHKEDTEEIHKRLLRSWTELHLHSESQQDRIPVVHPCIWTLYVLCERYSPTSGILCIQYAIRCSTDFWRESWWPNSLSDCDRQRMERCCHVKGDCGCCLTQNLLMTYRPTPIRRV